MEHHQKEDKFEILLSTLELKLQSSCFRREDEDEKEEEDCRDDFVKTPRSLEPPAVLECPPPPRKPRRFPSAKRKAGDSRSIFMSHHCLFGEMEVDLELLFPSNQLHGGRIVKKVKRRRFF
ncbi:cyclin-dependent protein kinase inhibitor SMR10-like [Cucurbita moschata]|uniref:Cyclin-dependent protein kinase inhibitor SMR10-like n=1 Tax=Cucurbita moschata TaxID=3662 RepID=A0A6J1G7X1_CUCMO|nr:cyclin-dependent protein kinase inhibitor SMR10-like [Cucurbita moschata]